MLYKANRVVHALDLHTPLAPILKTLTYDGDSWRRRDIQEGEEVESTWDELVSDNANLQWRTPHGHVSKDMPKHLIYTEADALEDEILFSDNGQGRFKAIKNGLTEFETERMKDSIMNYFITGGDVSDDDSDDFDPKYLENGTDDDLSDVDDDKEDDDAWEDEDDEDSAEAEDINKSVAAMTIAERSE